MTEKQKRFAEYYAACANATEAAKMAGYSDKTAGSQGQRLLKNVEIAGYIVDLQAQTEGNRIATIEQVKEFWSQVMCNKEEKTADRLKASEMLAKAAGVFINLSIIENETGEDVVIYLPDNGRDGGML